VIIVTRTEAGAAGVADHGLARGAADLSSADFQELYDRLRRRAGWGAQDRLGALNNASPARLVAAAQSVARGQTVSLAAQVEHEVSADNPNPWVHEFAMPEEGLASDGLDFAMDAISLHIHGDADSHIDALCHVSYDGTLYNDVAADRAGAAELSVSRLGQGIAGRGVLLDIPRLRGTRWLEPGDHVTAADLAEAERAQGVLIAAGDLLFVRVGHRRRRRELGAWDASAARAGLHPAAVEELAERRVVVLGSDGNNDTAPSAVDGIDFPVHVLAIRALGLPLLDYLALDDLATACEETGRWTFLAVIAPLRLPQGTGSPVNPIAVF
jgi:kynurenine formamidase